MNVGKQLRTNNEFRRKIERGLIMTDFPQHDILSDDWSFSYTPEIENLENPILPTKDVFTAKMPVPAYWDDYIDNLNNQTWMEDARFNEDYQPLSFTNYLQLEGEAGTLPDTSLPFLNGVGWYRREMQYPKELTCGYITLEIGGVSLEAWVWLNGRLLKYHFGHSTSFKVRLDKAYLSGESNELIIAVRNTRRDRLGFNLRGYKGYSGGISGPVNIKFAKKTNISEAYIYASNDNKTINWHVNVDQTNPSDTIQIHWLVRDPASSNILAEGFVPVTSNLTTWQTDKAGMKEWSDISPNLYDMEITLLHNKTIHDSKAQKFGLRNISTKGSGIFLNGCPIILRGVTEHCYFPLSCKPPFDVESYRKMLKKIKSLGFNWVRFHTWVPSEKYMQAADELGMLIQVEPPVGFGEQEWLDVLHACRQHPSVVIYCCGNEELLDENKIAKLQRMSEILREEVPNALFCPQEALRGVEYGWNDSDIGSEVLETPFLHNPSRLAKLKEFSDVFGQYAWGELSYTSVLGNWRRVQNNMQVYERPCLAHEVGILGSYIDLRLEERYQDTRIGTELYALARKGLETAGMIDRAPLFYQNSCEWSRILRKQAIENVRKCNTYAGYDYLGGIDQHNHQSGYNAGIMNEFYELKSGDSIELISNYNGASVLLLDCSTNRNFTCGDEFNLELFVSLYGSEHLDKASLTWILKDSKEHVVLSDEFVVENIKNGAVSSLGTIKFVVPNLENPEKLTLVTSLSGNEYDITNDWDFWAFPSVKNEEFFDVEIISSLDTGAIDVLDQGGKIVLLGDTPFPSTELDFQISKAGRVHGNLATVINDHPVTNTFSHDGFCAWQFYSMFQTGTAVIFDDLDIPFAPIVEVASNYKTVKKQACMFEFEVGSGKLFVCSLNLNSSDPASVWLKHTIIKYATSANFNPKEKVDLKTIKKLVKEWDPNLKKKTAKTVEAFDPNAQLK